MKESGWYPPGTEFDPSAPWNEKEDDSIFELELNNKELHIKRKYDFSAEDEWEEETAVIDPEKFEVLAAEKLNLVAEEKWVDAKYLEFENIKDLPQENFQFITSWGIFESNMNELIGLTNLF